MKFIPMKLYFIVISIPNITNLLNVQIDNSKGNGMYRKMERQNGHCKKEFLHRTNVIAKKKK